MLLEIRQRLKLCEAHLFFYLTWSASARYCIKRRCSTLSRCGYYYQIAQCSHKLMQIRQRVLRNPIILWY